MSTTTGNRGGRPLVMGTRAVVSSGHYLATQIGMDILRRGGNAADAAVATGFALSLTMPHQNGIAGENPTLVYEAGPGQVWAVSGHGPAPQAATIGRFRELRIERIPGDGFLGAIVPPAVATYLLMLRRFGTMRLADVLMPSIELAERGFGMYDALHGAIARLRDRFAEEWPSSAALFLRDGQAPPLGSVFKNPDWGRTFRRLLAAESEHRQREAGLQAAHDVFYLELAETMTAFCRSTAVRDATGRAHNGLLTTEDFAAYSAEIEAPVTTTFAGIQVHKCSTWTQSPVLLQTLNLLAGYDLAAMGHNSTAYIHTVVECMKLAYADREFYYGDPAHVEVPIARLLSLDYAAERRALVGPEASMLLRPGGAPAITAADVGAVEAAALPGPASGDTTKLEVIDAAGNMVSATVSGGWLFSSPIIPGLGFPLGTRGQMFALNPAHPNCLAPGKRPRTTLSPGLATMDGRPFMSFGSPGGDCQDQWALQSFLNTIVFGMSLQEAVEAPTFWTQHFPNSFYPRQAVPGSVTVEDRIPASVRDELTQRGHQVSASGPWSGGNTLAAMIDPDTGLRCAAASPRLDPATAAAW